MSWKDCLKIFWNNIKIEKSMFFQIILGLTVIVIMLFCVGIYGISYHDYVNEFDKTQLDECYYVKYINEDYTENEYIEKSKEWLIENEYVGGVDTCMFNSVEIKTTPNIKNIILECDEKIEEKTNIYVVGSEYFDGLKYDVNEFKWTNYDSRFRIFSENVISKFEKEYPDEEYMIGELPDEEGEVLLSDFTLMCLGIPQGKQESMIGKKISIASKDKDTKLLNEYYLSGIYNAKILPIQENTGFSSFSINNMIIHFRSEERKKIRVHEIRYFLDSFQNYSKEENVNRIVKDKLEMTNQGNLYMFSRKEMNILQRIFLFIFILIIVAVTICVRTLLRFYWKKKNAYIKLLKMLGMQNRYITIIVVLELFFSIILALALGIYISTLLMLLSQGASGDIVHFQLKLELYDIMGIACITFFYLMVNMDVFFIKKNITDRKDG